MTSIKLIIDSASDFIKTEELQTLGIRSSGIVSSALIVDDEEYWDTQVTLPASKINQLISSVEPSQRSSASPNLSDFYQQLQDAEQSLVITLSEAASGTFNTANLAKNMALEEDPTKEIVVLPSLGVSAEERLLVEEFHRLQTQSLAFEELVSQLIEYRNQLKSLAILENPETVYLTGRMQETPQASEYTILQRNDSSQEGFVSVYATTTQENRWKDFIEALVTVGYTGGRIAISHNEALESAQQLLKEIQKQFPSASAAIHPIAPSVSLHFSKGSIYLAFEASE